MFGLRFVITFEMSLKKNSTVDSDLHRFFSKNCKRFTANKRTLGSKLGNKEFSFCFKFYDKLSSCNRDEIQGIV